MTNAVFLKKIEKVDVYFDNDTYKFLCKKDGKTITSDSLQKLEDIVKETHQSLDERLKLFGKPVTVYVLNDNINSSFEVFTKREGFLLNDFLYTNRKVHSKKNVYTEEQMLKYSKTLENLKKLYSEKQILLKNTNREILALSELFKKIIKHIDTYE